MPPRDVVVSRAEFVEELPQAVAPTLPEWPAPLAQEAFYGLVGDIVRIIAPHRS